MSIKYTGFSKRCGKIRKMKSGKSERRDIARLYGMFDGDTMITCISPRTKKHPEYILDELKLEDIFEKPI